MSPRLPVSPSRLFSRKERTMNTYQHILFEQEGPIAYITLNRPAKRNALSIEHMQELIGCLKAIGQRREAAVVILRGNGPAFCAGHDLGEMIGQSPEFYQH